MGCNMANTKALNAARMKERNYLRFFNELRLKPMTRAQIARRMDITRASTSLIADDLLSTGIIKEGPSDETGRQSAKVLSWNAESFHIAGIYINRDHITTGISDFCGNVFDVRSTSIVDITSTDEAMSIAVDNIREMLENNNPAGDFLGIGVASPGPLDTQTGIILDPPFFELFQNYPVADRLRDVFKCDVVLENDANALALAERSYGVTAESDRFLELLVDMGIGASLVLDGKLISGPSGLGNGFGHTSININGPKCDCGNNGCVEIYATIPRIVEVAKKLDPSLDSWHAIVDKSYTNNASALHVLHTEASYLATLIVNASNVLDIQAVIFAGDYILYRPAMILEEIEREVNRRITSRSERKITILPSQLPPKSKVISATNLITEKYLERPFIFGTSARYGKSI